MNRLTDKPRTVSMCISVDECKRHNRLWEYENTGLTPDEITAMQIKLLAYRQAEQAGRLVRVVRCKDCAHGRWKDDTGTGDRGTWRECNEN